MPHDDPAATYIQEHGRTDLTGVGTFLESTQILPTNRDRGSPKDSNRLRQVRIWGTNDDVDPFAIAASSKSGEQRSVALKPAIHLPVPDNQLFPHLEHQS